MRRGRGPRDGTITRGWDGEEVILLVWYTSLALEESREAERLMLID